MNENVFSHHMKFYFCSISATIIDEQKKVFNRLVEEKSYEFRNLKEKTNPNNFIYNYKTRGRTPKDFSDY